MKHVLRFLALWFAVVRPVSAADLWVVDPAGLGAGERALLASVQGVLNRTSAVVWVKSGGINARITSDLVREDWRLVEGRTPLDLVRHFRSAFSGLILCNPTNESLNVATSLAAITNALVVDAPLAERLRSEGLPVLADARGITPALAWKRYGPAFTRGVAVHQAASKSPFLRDLAISLGAWTFFDVSSEERTRYVRELGPNTRVLGWGVDEHDFVRDISAGGGAVLPADWSLNLSALRHLKVPLPALPRRPEPAPLKPGERVVAFVVSDGDNLQWMGGGFPTASGFWASTNRGSFPVSWEMAPTLAEYVPRVIAHFYDTATTNDDFVCGPSGFGYQFPSLLPDRKSAAAETARWSDRTGLGLVSVLDSGGAPDRLPEWLEQKSVAGVLYKDYAPYNKHRGAVAWHAGKPAVAYRYLLWEEKGRDGTLRRDWLPQGISEAVAAMPPAAGGEAGFALVNVHAWSFRETGGPMGAIRETIGRLPPDVRVVTATDFFRLLMKYGKR